MFILGITGHAVCGKSLGAERLSEHGLTHLDFSKDLLAPMLRKRGKGITSQRMINLALYLRHKGGSGALAKHLYLKLPDHKNYVLAGIRYPEEVNFFRQKLGANFKLLTIKSKLGLRYARTIQIYEHRKKTYGGRDPSFKEFLRQEDEGTEKILKRTMRMSNYNITNNGTKKEYFVKLDNLAKRL